MAQLDGLTFSPDGRHAYASGPTVFDVDQRSGALHAAAGPGARFSSSDTGGACQQLSAAAAGDDPLVSPDGRTVYALATNTVEPVISVLARNTSTGALRQPPGRRGCIAQHGARDTCTIGAKVSPGCPTWR